MLAGDDGQGVIGWEWYHLGHEDPFSRGAEFVSKCVAAHKGNGHEHGVHPYVPGPRR